MVPFVPAALLALLLSIATPLAAHAADAKSEYFAAERCYLQLRNNEARQKHRDRWLRCIDKYLAVHRHAPRGPWAPAGLYKAGILYAELYKRSYYKGDKQEALDIFDRVIRGYPKSDYRARSQEAKRSLLTESFQKPDPSKADTARSWYNRAQAARQRLDQRSVLKKYRDQWFKVIDAFRKAHDSDPQGPLAAASLYGLASAYNEMYAHSFRASDRRDGQKYEQLLVDSFPDSEYTAKVNAGRRGSVTAAGDESVEIAQAIADNSDYGATANDGEQTASVADPAVVQGLRFWSNPRYTRVVVDADKDTVFTYHELREDPSIGKPQRIYIDVHHSRLGKSTQKVVPINDDLLSDARAGQYTSDVVRVVVDIKSFKTYKIFSLKNPFRVVLDVWGTDAGAPEPGLPAIARPEDGKLPPSAIVKQLALGVRRIIIDPGHGGKDYGAPGYLKGVHEKDIALQIAKRLRKMIRDELKYDVILTRDKDEYLSLEERTAIANTKNADLFISIHTNASRDRRAYGIETFILNLATDDEAIRVAARENATSAKNISDLDSILQDLMQNAKVSESTRLASYVQQSVSRSLKHKYKQVKSKGIKQAPFYVLLGADMPSILVETSFISNPRECKRLSSSDYQTQLCHGIVQGIKRYIKETNPTAFAPAASRGEPG